MTNQDKHIEELAQIIERARIKAADTTNSMNYGFGGWYAKELYAKGYRKASDVAKEIFAEIDRTCVDTFGCFYIGATRGAYTELKKKYTEDEK